MKKVLSIIVLLFVIGFAAGQILSDDKIWVTFADIATVALYDLQGRMVYSQNPSNSPTEHSPTATVNMRNIPAGVYVLRVTDGEGKEYRQKVVRR